MFKRYLVFSFIDCYPNGGMNDLTKTYDTLQEVYDYIKEEIKRYTHDEINFNCLDIIEKREIKLTYKNK